jgi:hypothetical protein
MTLAATGATEEADDSPSPSPSPSTDSSNVSDNGTVVLTTTVVKAEVVSLSVSAPADAPAAPAVPATPATNTLVDASASAATPAAPAATVTVHMPGAEAGSTAGGSPLPSSLTLRVPAARLLLLVAEETLALERLHAEVVTDWWRLFWRLLGRYHDGYRYDAPAAGEYTATPIFYPTWWLRAIRFWRQHADDAVVTGKTYAVAQTEARGVKSEFEALYPPPPEDAGPAPIVESQEWDSKYYPGEHCSAPRGYNGTGAYAYIEDSLVEERRRAAGLSVPFSPRSGLQQSSNPVSEMFWQWIWWLLAGVSVFAVGYIVGHTRSASSLRAEYASIPIVDEHIY